MNLLMKLAYFLKLHQLFININVIELMDLILLELLLQHMICMISQMLMFFYYVFLYF